MNKKLSIKSSSKLKIKLDGEMPCHTALSSVLLQNLNVLENCEAGIIADKDNEFLHSFRIAGRRSRSLINQIKQVYPESRISRYRNAFSWLSECTGTHRDLDVFLSALHAYKKEVALINPDDLEPLREHLVTQRKQEHALLLNTLTSKRYASFKINWRAYLLLTEKKPSRTRYSSKPIIKIANKAIWHNYQKLIKPGKIIVTSAHTYEGIHTLRKNAKKLRYLLESFKSIYSAKDIDHAIKILKKLQDNLGMIVDMNTQKYMLEEWKQELKTESNVSAQTVSAINQLVVLCNKKKQIAKSKFKNRFNQFSTKHNQNLFKKIFH